MHPERLQILRHITEIKHPQLTARLLWGNDVSDAYGKPDLVINTLNSFPAVRAITNIVLLFPEAAILPRDERMGLLLFTCLVMEADHLLDSGSVPRVNSVQLQKDLLASRISYHSSTVNDLVCLTLQCFPRNKQELITGFLEMMTSYHLENGFSRAGNYDFCRALDYRRFTDDKWIDTTLLLAGITSQASARWMKAVGILGQLRDDLRDWPLDWQHECVNLFLGLCYETSPGELYELQSIQEKLADIPGEHLKSIIPIETIRVAPITYRRYKQSYAHHIGFVPDAVSRLILTMKGL